MIDITEEKIRLADELHRPARRNYPRRQVIIRGLDETWQADLVDMTANVDDNNGYKYILTVIDNFSKYAWAVPLKSKSGFEVAKMMRSIFIRDYRVPKKLQVDKGKEFYNRNFQSLMAHNQIHMYSTESNLKPCIVERFNRTLKEKMWKLFSLYGSYKWIDILSQIVLTYNNTKHRTIKMKPKDVTTENEKTIRQEIYGNFIVNNPTRGKYKVGDRVRISKFKHIFEKGYTPNWTTEIFTVRKELITQPVTYLLRDYQQEDNNGCFYEHELSAVKYPDVYLVEKIVKKTGKESAREMVRVQ